MACLGRFTVYALAVAVPLAMGSAAHARGTIGNDSYVEGGLVLYPDWGSQDFIGPEVRGRVAVNDNWFALGGFQYLTDDNDITTFHIGGAFRLNPDGQEEVELWVGPTIEYQEQEHDFVDPVTGNTRTASEDDLALGVRGGVRFAATQQLELNGEVRLVTGDFDYLGLMGQANYALNAGLDVYGRLDSYDGELGLGGGVRYSF